MHMVYTYLKFKILLVQLDNIREMFPELKFFTLFEGNTKFMRKKAIIYSSKITQDHLLWFLGSPNNMQQPILQIYKRFKCVTIYIYLKKKL